MSEVKMVRGDTYAFTVSLRDENRQPVLLTDGDRVILTIKRRVSDIAPALQKTVTEFPDGKASFRIAPEETAKLQYGCYAYDVEWRRGDDVYTIIRCSNWWLLQEITTK